MNIRDRIAIISIAEILFDHLREGEDPKSPDLLPSDRLRGVITVLTENVEGDQEHDK